MSKALSVDLRERVLRAIVEGMSGRQAGLRFGVSAASVSRWRNLALRQGNAKLGPLGGDRSSQRIEAQASVILGLVEEKPDMTLAEIRAALLERGHAFGIGTLWRFFERHRICARQPSEPSQPFGLPSGASSTRSGRPNASTSLRTQDMMQCDETALINSILGGSNPP